MTETIANPKVSRDEAVRMATTMFRGTVVNRNETHVHIRFNDVMTAAAWSQTCDLNPYTRIRESGTFGSPCIVITDLRPLPETIERSY